MRASSFFVLACRANQRDSLVTSHAAVARFISRNPPAANQGQRWWRFTVLAIITLAATVPFLDKGFHIDDHAYLQVARHILEDPFRPHDFVWVAEGRAVYAYDYDWSPPFFKYILALGLIAFGESEVLLHCVSGVFTACLCISTYVMAKRFTSWPLLTTVLVLLNPLFVPSQNLMLDTPMLALGMTGLAFHVYGTDRDSIWLVIAGGIFAGLSIVTKYPALIVLPLMVIYSVLRRSWMVVLGVCVALIPLMIWSMQNVLVQGDLHIAHSPVSGVAHSWSELGRRVVAVVGILGSGFFPMLAGSRLPHCRSLHMLALFLSFGLAAAWQLFQEQTYWWQGVEHVLFLSGGLFLVVLSLECAWKNQLRLGGLVNRDRLFVVLWMHLGWLVSLLSPFVAVRHLLWALPPASLLVTQTLTHCGSFKFRAKAIIWIISLLGLAVGMGDKEIANLYRQTVATMRTNMEEQKASVSYLGEHGFANYCEKAGASPVILDGRQLEPRSFVVASSSTAWAMTPNLKRSLTHVQSVRSTGYLPVNTISYGVNFYSTGTADLPWELGRPSRIYVDVYSVNETATEFPKEELQEKPKARKLRCESWGSKMRSKMRDSVPQKRHKDEIY